MPFISWMSSRQELYSTLLLLLLLPPSLPPLPATTTTFIFFTPLRYVPNVAKRSTWDQCKKYILRTDRPTNRPTNDRPTSHLAHIGEISNGHISARGRPIHFMFGSTVRFSGSADRMALFPVSPNSRWRLGRHLGKFKWRYLRGGSSDLLRVWF